jgi:hypothetical protein
MDQALTKAARAGSPAGGIDGQCRDFNQQELKQALDQMKRWSTTFRTIRQVTQSTSGTVRGEWRDLVSNAPGRY